MWSPHEILGVREGATFEEVKQAYRQLVLKYHPDRHGNSEKAKEVLQIINEAYRVLKESHAQRTATTFESLPIPPSLNLSTKSLLFLSLMSFATLSPLIPNFFADSQLFISFISLNFFFALTLTLSFSFTQKQNLSPIEGWGLALFLSLVGIGVTFSSEMETFQPLLLAHLTNYVCLGVWLILASQKKVNSFYLLATLLACANLAFTFFHWNNFFLEQLELPSLLITLATFNINFLFQWVALKIGALSNP